MNSNAHLSETFLQLKNDEVYLKEIVNRYPWCSVAQLYLLYHYQKNSSSSFNEQAKKTALYFNNTSWLKWQLHLLGEEAEIQEKKVEVKDKEILITPEEKNEQLENIIADIKSQANTNEDVIAFEPLHTVDYFASQGIKITEEPVTNDKLGTQMKSFTEWLKSMKKIHKENLPAGDEQTDKNIQRLAEHSNADVEIVTEAMAEVLIKQNKTEKAIEVYEKLSLQNPSKSDYFAAKINSLKAS